MKWKQHIQTLISNPHTSQEELHTTLHQIKRELGAHSNEYIMLYNFMNIPEDSFKARIFREFI